MPTSARTAQTDFHSTRAHIVRGGLRRYTLLECTHFLLDGVTDSGHSSSSPLSAPHGVPTYQPAVQLRLRLALRYYKWRHF